MKDAKGHGSNSRGAEGNTATGAPWDYGKTLGGPLPTRKYPENPHPDSAVGRAMRASGEGVQTQLFGDTTLQDKMAAETLAQGHPKSDAPPTHDGMNKPAGDGRQYWGTAKVRNSYKSTGPHPDRETARDAAYALNPRAKTVSTGYGNGGGYSDVRWHDSPGYSPGGLGSRLSRK